MKAVTPELLALLNSIGGTVPLIKADLYYFTLASGAGALLYGTADYPITAADATIWNPPAIDGSGGLWRPGLLWQQGMIGAPDSQTRGHWKAGLDTDTWQVQFSPQVEDSDVVAADLINGVPWLEAAQAGALDNADLIVATAYFAAMPLHPIPLAGVSPVGTIIKFRGLMGAVDCSDSAAYAEATDYRALLNQMAPTNIYQSGCRNRLFDARCTLNPAGFTATAVAAVSPAGIVNASTPVAAPAGSATFTLGTLTMTSGLNAGQSRLVTLWDGGEVFSLLNPFPYVVAAGDAFSVTAGCNKTQATCAAFANTVNFRGEPYIPIPEVSLG